MAMYYNGKPVNPIVSLLVTATVVAGIFGLGLFLLPILGGILLIVLALGVGVFLWAAYQRWRYGDPLEKMAQAMRQAQAQAGGENPTQASHVYQDSSSASPRQARTGVRRTTTIDEAVVVGEIRHDKSTKTE